MSAIDTLIATPERALFGHVDEESAYLVEDYPYGFRLRTSIRYWIETTKNGDRFVSQTLNPKTDAWNKPKKSTYVDVGVMFLDDEDHVTWTGVGSYTSDEVIGQFRESFFDKLSDGQKKKLARLIGLRKAFEGVTWSVREKGTDAEEAAADAKQAEALEYLRKKAAIETVRTEKEFGLR